MKKLHIAIMCDSIDTIVWWSYISAQRFAKWLTDLWHHIIWCTSSFIEQSKKKEFWYATLYEFASLFPIGPQKVRFAYPKVSQLTSIFQKEHIDIIYNIHPGYLWWQAHRAGKLLNITVIHHSHVQPDNILPHAPHRLEKRIYKLLARFYRKWNGVIFPTEFGKKEFDGYKLEKKKIVISNGVNTDIFMPPKSKPKDKFNILYTWRLDKEKNIRVLLDALYLLKKQDRLTSNIHCKIRGDWSEEKRLRQLTKSYSLQDTVSFIEKTPDQKSFVNLYQECSVFVLPSLCELESMVTLEAMACGCAILIADSPKSAAKNFVKENGYTFNLDTPEDLADKISWLATHPDVLGTMQKKSIENIQSFAFNESIKKLESFFISFL